MLTDLPLFYAVFTALVALFLGLIWTREDALNGLLKLGHLGVCCGALYVASRCSVIPTAVLFGALLWSGPLAFFWNTRSTLNTCIKVSLCIVVVLSLVLLFSF